MTLDLNMAKFEATGSHKIGRQRQTGHDQILPNTSDLAAGAFKGKLHALTRRPFRPESALIGNTFHERVNGMAWLSPCRRLAKPSATKAFKILPRHLRTDLASINSIGIEAFAGTDLTSAKIYATTLGENFPSFRPLPSVSATTIRRKCSTGCTAIDRHHSRFGSFDNRREALSKAVQGGDP